MATFDKVHNQRVLRAIHNAGIEMTPTELVATRKEMFAKVRREMRKRGLDVPDDDEGLFQLMVEADVFGE